MTAEDEDLYRCLLRLSEATPADLSDHLGWPLSHVEEWLARLESVELTALADNGCIRPAPPAIAVQRLIDLRLRELREELQRVAAEQRVVESLLAERHAVRPVAGEMSERPAIERVEGTPNVRAVIDELTFFTRQEGLTTQPHGALSAASIEASRPLDARILRRGIQMRTIMRSEAVEDGPTLAYLQEISAMGAEIRISDKPLERMLVFDRAAALTPIDPQNPRLGALVIREAGLVANLVSLFERMWSDSVDLREAVAARQGAGATLTEIERKVLATMYEAEKDESGAREVGVSVRTYRKYVADLMQRLGATNRFQAALLARDHGWI
ncbi:LuxR C-terminal-related transcriptional regulator [Streptomyces sp. APSN-46.1]|uniref:LuxR C-terminal-related transcriptional regulator n=1 Tax=Streptomyces sp. APSN-46.1 TaxID=2929049 RepID=UPI001FB26864|nr:LuxR C-terminal-related transcriptional regulator [Streptomyces sp. APSN-46.1]MCJ1678483.1 LuxR C-terminal-related transcriptional regulator [Streptomyces sp. APSN-46.1]